MSQRVPFNEQINKMRVGRWKKVCSPGRGLAFLWLILGHVKRGSSHILGRVSVLGNKYKLVLQKIFGGHVGC